MQRRFLFAALLLPTASLGLAQNDECSTATVVGPGSYPFDTTIATLSAEPWPCAGNGGPDLWYQVNATTSATYTVSTCGSGYDTALEAFSGVCGSLVSIVCNDDSCGFQSRIQFAVTAGQTYYVRVGGWNNNVGIGTITFNDGSPVLNPVNGNWYVGVSAPGITWTNARAAAAATSHMGIPGRLVTLNDQQENDFVFQSLGGVNNYWVGGFQNLSSPSYSEPGGGWEWITGEPFSFTQWLPGEPNNTGGFGAEDFLELLQSTGFGETWNDAAEQEHPAGYVIEFSSSGIGTNYCTPVANSTGSPASMRGTGSATVASNSFGLECNSMPNNSFAYFLTSATQGFVMSPGTSIGNLCLAGAIGRYVGPGQIQNSGGAGMVAISTNLLAHPQPAGPVAVQAGQTWNFQCWYRDVSGGVPVSNFSDGLSVMFN